MANVNKFESNPTHPHVLQKKVKKKSLQLALQYIITTYGRINTFFKRQPLVFMVEVARHHISSAQLGSLTVEVTAD